MKYQILAANVSESFSRKLKSRLAGMDGQLTKAQSVRDALHLCTNQHYHLLVLKVSDISRGSEAVAAVRSTSFTPIIVLLDQYDIESACALLKQGADLCLGTDWPPYLLIEYIMAQFRRYTAYSQYENPQGYDAAPFRGGDIYIDPLRRIVRVRDRDVKLRRREFDLLLYFMKNPKVILSAEQICDNAWGNEGSYASGVSSPISILRKAIEPDPAHPIYIETVNTLGYRFTEHKED